MAPDIYLVFLLATAVVVFTPGAAALAMASQGAANGGRRALAGVLGVAMANVVYFALSATGIAALIVASNLLFSVIKWVGVAYLVWLGLTALLSDAGPISAAPARERSSLTRLFALGFVIEIANPKALLYFAAILPQFLDAEAPVLPQILIMGATCLAIDLTVYSAYAFLGGRIAQGGLRGWAVRALNKTAGGALLLTGARMASVSAP